MGMVGSGHARRALLVALTSGCAPPDELEPLPIDVCGQDTPKQILALGDDEFVDPNEGVARFGDRWLFGVRRFEIPLTSIESTSASADDRPFAQLDARVESVGSCGEDRRVVAQEVDFLIPPLSDDAPWLGCRRDTGDVYWIDPDGARAERPIGRANVCQQVTVRGHDVFFLTRDSAEYVRARLSEEDVVVDVLLTDVVQKSGDEMMVDGEYVPANDILLLRGEARVLVRLDLATTEVTEVVDRVDEFAISPDRRWLMSIRRIPNNPNDFTVPSAELMDLVNRIGVVFWQEDWGDLSARVGVSFASLDATDAAGSPMQTWVMATPASTVQALESNVTVRGSDGADILVITSAAGVEILELSTGDRRLLADAKSPSVDDATLFYEDELAHEDLDVPDEYLPLDVVRMPLATLEAEVAYARVFSNFELPNDRWLASSPADENQLADLMLIDGESLDIRRVDRNVVPALRLYDVDFDLEYRQPWRSDELVYQVHERASDRGGMWRVRFTE